MDLRAAPAGQPAASMEEVISRMRAIEAALPAHDGVACFNRMYLEVTLGVSEQLARGSFGDPSWVSGLDVVFANRYFAAVEAMDAPAPAQPRAWRPLLAARGRAGIEPIQFALAGMNVHINYDLPLALVAACLDQSTALAEGSHHEDYQRIDQLLDASEQAVRESFEPTDIRRADRHVAAVANLVCDWSINEARDAAWDTALGLWAVRDHDHATELLTGALAGVVEMATRTLLVAV